MLRREDLLQQVRTLGRAFVQRGLASQARRLRVYYLALTHDLTESGNKLHVQWSEDFVAEWLALLDLPPFRGAYEVRGPADGCPRCPIEHQAPGARHCSPLSSVRTMMVFPGGAKMQCLRCQHAWVARDHEPTSL